MKADQKGESRARSPLSLEEFEAALASHGSRLERWPAAARAGAEALLASSAPAQALLLECSRVDALLDALPEVLPSAGLAARVASVPILHPERGLGAWWPFASFYRPLLAWSAAALVGLFVGKLVPYDAGADMSSPDRYQALVSADEGAELDEQDWDELSQLSLGDELELEESL